MAATDATGALAGFATMTGTPEQVRHRLDHLGGKPKQVIALTLEHGSEPAVRALAETFESIAPLVGAILARRETEAMQSILELLVPHVPPPQHMLLEARMTAEARKAVLESGEWLTAAQIAEMAGFSTNNPSAQPNKWKKDGIIFAVRHRGIDYFPGYALDPKTGYRPLKALAAVLKVFNGSKDDWGLAYWFASDNSFLSGKRPQDLLVEQSERVIAAAEDERQGVTHG
ncbi:hypothetical protein V5F77_26220 [Xanthobacter sp. DSM 24535]|uniref:hypothetical protein n=1 Tax=Roseixanthobacter psychrophilus TaxID=3119917 RepID=UPI00372667ED